MKRFLKYVVAITSLLIVTSFVYLGIAKPTYSINKTVNWAWEFTNINFWIAMITYALLLVLMLSIMALLLIKLKDRLTKPDTK